MEQWTPLVCLGSALARTRLSSSKTQTENYYRHSHVRRALKASLQAFNGNAKSAIITQKNIRKSEVVGSVDVRHLTASTSRRQVMTVLLQLTMMNLIKML